MRGTPDLRLGLLIFGLVVLVHSVNSGLPVLLSGPSSLFLDRYEECISLLNTQPLEVGPWYDYS